MKKKGFTLIELLAVIIIMAVISLIATPIILNIIDNSKESANQRSVELYKKAIMNAFVEYQMVNNAAPSSFNDLESYINVQNKIDDCTTKVFKNGYVYLSCDLDNKNYTTGNLYYCYSNDNTVQTRLGSEYYCSFDDNDLRKYYVLDYEEGSTDNYLYLILNENFRNNDVPGAMKWCENLENCDEPYILNEYISKIQELYGDDVEVMLPSKEQIEKVPLINDNLPEWLSNFNYVYKSIIVGGFWTSTSYSSNIAYTVYEYSYDNTLKLRNSWLFGSKTSGDTIGLRPVVKVNINQVM